MPKIESNETIRLRIAYRVNSKRYTTVLRLNDTASEQAVMDTWVALYKASAEGLEDTGRSAAFMMESVQKAPIDSDLFLPVDGLTTPTPQTLQGDVQSGDGATLVSYTYRTTNGRRGRLTLCGMAVSLGTRGSHLDFRTTPTELGTKWTPIYNALSLLQGFLVGTDNEPVVFNLYANVSMSRKYINKMRRSGG